MTDGTLQFQTLAYAAMARFLPSPNFSDGIPPTKTCRTCGQTYQPNSRTQLDCLPCRAARGRKRVTPTALSQTNTKEGEPIWKTTEAMEGAASGGPTGTMNGNSEPACTCSVCLHPDGVCAGCYEPGRFDGPACTYCFCFTSNRSQHGYGYLTGRANLHSTDEVLPSADRRDGGI